MRDIAHDLLDALAAGSFIISFVYWADAALSSVR